MQKFGDRPLTGEEVRWGLEHLTLTTERLRELGLEGLMAEIAITCARGSRRERGKGAGSAALRPERRLVPAEGASVVGQPLPRAGRSAVGRAHIAEAQEQEILKVRAIEVSSGP
ncbi:hypothetical protein [Paracoccus mutanolyticus]|uniref:hypothetical protein n=1 Tax=Paracoccus mutanolyticus TaxID=1499308 RepID=UPI0011AE9808|nr:hypothetical protein [Paracoccus mutanolyticus]